MTGLLTVKQAAERATVCERLIRSWVADGTLPCYRLGVKGSRGKISIAESDLDGVIASFRVTAVKPAPKARRAPAPAFKFIRA